MRRYEGLPGIDINAYLAMLVVVNMQLNILKLPTYKGQWRSVYHNAQRAIVAAARRAHASDQNLAQTPLCKTPPDWTRPTGYF